MRTLEAAARRLKPASAVRGAAGEGRRLPRLWLFTDPVRLPDPLAAAARLPGRGRAGVVARGLARPVLARLAALARARGLVLLVAADGRAALALHAGLHLPERRGTMGLLPFLRARRRRHRRGVLLSLAAHGGAGAAARARRLGADLAFLSPVFPTMSHLGAAGLGPLRWAAAARRLSCPAVALGGIGTKNAGRLSCSATSGIAAITGLS